MSDGEIERRSLRRTLRDVTGITAATALVSTAGCLDLMGLGGPSGGAIPAGGAPSLQTVSEDDADVVVHSVDALIDYAARGGGLVIWIPAGLELDFSGRDLVIRGTTVASGRSKNGEGAIIRTTDEGANSPVWGGGSGTGFIRIEDGGRLTGVMVQGPHTNVTDHPVLRGYFPFAPGGESARRRWRRARFARAISVVGDNVRIDNCEIAYFSVQGICVGPEGFVENCVIAYCHVHNTLMTSYGYCVDVRHGDCTVYRSYLDAARHAMCGSGYADSNYSVVETTFGPWATNHPIDMHRVGNNTDGSSDPDAIDYTYRAGGTILIRDCDIMPVRVPDLPFINHNQGGGTPHVSIRGVPKDGFYFENNRCAHPSPDRGIAQSGIPGRYVRDGAGWVNMNVSDNNQWEMGFEALESVP